ncbi:MAG: metalloregulator ArsR/SmtB family transcription factor [Alphaproteobacteria bacterium]|nr:metalloregulator ArsR/SmtB family transcription factor [Rhodospirillales bacterium]MCW9045817.1 metalloregulator ArsR/SmtB family transcription factor [Alphaproteobacteria bacterium]
MNAIPKIEMNLEEMFENAGRVSSFLKAMANDNRLVILCKLAEGEKNVGELEELLGIRQPTLSQQLARLRMDGLVSTRRESKQIYYSLASSEVAQVIGLLYQLFCSPDAGPGQKTAEAA